MSLLKTLFGHGPTPEERLHAEDLLTGAGLVRAHIMRSAGQSWPGILLSSLNRLARAHPEALEERLGVLRSRAAEPVVLAETVLALFVLGFTTEEVRDALVEIAPHLPGPFDERMVDETVSIAREHARAARERPLPDFLGRDQMLACIRAVLWHGEVGRSGGPEVPGPNAAPGSDPVAPLVTKVGRRLRLRYQVSDERLLEAVPTVLDTMAETRGRREERQRAVEAFLATVAALEALDCPDCYAYRLWLSHMNGLASDSATTLIWNMRTRLDEIRMGRESRRAERADDLLLRPGADPLPSLDRLLDLSDAEAGAPGRAGANGPVLDLT